MMMSKLIGMVALLALSMTAQAATTYSLPDPAVSVNPNYSNTTTLVTIGSVLYKGKSNYYYVGECAKPDTSGYHCNVEEEDEVLLTALDGSTVTVTIVMQSSATLIRSGHNYWRSAYTILDGSVTVN